MRNIVAALAHVLLGLRHFAVALAARHGHQREVLVHFHAVGEVLGKFIHGREERGIELDAFEIGHPDFHLEFGIAERRAVRKQVSLDGGALFERRHQVFGIKRGRTRLEVQHLDAVGVHLQQLLIDGIYLLAHHVTHAAFVTVVEQQRTFDAEPRLLVIPYGIGPFLVGTAFAEGLRAHAQFKIVLCKAEPVKLVTEFQLVPEFRIPFARGGLGTLLRRLVAGVVLGRFYKLIPCERFREYGCRKHGGEDCNAFHYLFSFFLSFFPLVSEMVTISPSRNGLFSGILMVTSRP